MFLHVASLHMSEGIYRYHTSCLTSIHRSAMQQCMWCSATELLSPSRCISPPPQVWDVTTLVKRQVIARPCFTITKALQQEFVVQSCVTESSVILHKKAAYISGATSRMQAAAQQTVSPALY